METLYKDMMSKSNPAHYEPDTDDNIVKIVIYRHNGETVGHIANTEGQKASFRIYLAIARRFVCQLNAQSARFGLGLYGDYVAEERRTPNRHPNIRRLLDIIEYQDELRLKLITSS